MPRGAVTAWRLTTPPQAALLTTPPQAALLTTPPQAALLTTPPQAAGTLASPARASSTRAVAPLPRHTRTPLKAWAGWKSPNLPAAHEAPSHDEPDGLPEEPTESYDEPPPEESERPDQLVEDELSECAALHHPPTWYGTPFVSQVSPHAPSTAAPPAVHLDLPTRPPRG